MNRKPFLLFEVKKIVGSFAKCNRTKKSVGKTSERENLNIPIAKNKIWFCFENKLCYKRNARRIIKYK